MPNSIPSTALLALKRFVRGPLRQMGMGVVSLMLILGLSVQMPTEGTTTGVTGRAIANTTLSMHTQQMVTDRSVQHGTDSAMGHDLSRPSHLLSSHMTHHRLTGARFSIPTRREHRAIASLASTK